MDDNCPSASGDEEEEEGDEEYTLQFKLRNETEITRKTKDGKKKKEEELKYKISAWRRIIGFMESMRERCAYKGIGISSMAA